ncbi:hypothetical protein Rmf_21320 [Roseomonas fluvialis]|uniref:Uncharacterized protein n=1 Tax=Roseomonas fluvialis TaxID=1750527 RepID=A0ABN6P2K2_9PROT|nr:hypothetical protein Rmf_21320 [Roseomonas fluvialis]
MAKVDGLVPADRGNALGQRRRGGIRRGDGWGGQGGVPGDVARGMAPVGHALVPSVPGGPAEAELGAIAAGGQAGLHRAEPEGLAGRGTSHDWLFRKRCESVVPL